MKATTSFGKFAHAWDAMVGDHGVVSNESTIKAIFDLIGSIKGKSIYELTCGNGYLSRKFIASGAKQVYASDVAPEMIKIAKNNYGSEGIQYLVREATNFKGIPKEHFDAVIINKGAFYIKDVDALMKGIRSVLKPGGYLIFDILHPLFPAFRKATKADNFMGEPLDLIKLAQVYLKVYIKTVHKDWKINGKITRAVYKTYKRPISYYINACGKHGLLVESVLEPASKSRIKGNVVKSSIPGSLIIKAVKI